jgi:hypothetical protein
MLRLLSRHNVYVPGSNVDVIRRLNAAFNAGDSDGFQNLLAGGRRAAKKRS